MFRIEIKVNRFPALFTSLERLEKSRIELIGVKQALNYVGKSCSQLHYYSISTDKLMYVKYQG